MHHALATHGLTDIHTLIHAESWPGNSPATHLLALTIDQLRPALLAAGHTPAQLDRTKHQLTHPELVIATPPLYSTTARKPTA